MDITPEGREALRKAMEDERLDLGLTWRELAARSGGLSYETFRNARNGDAGLDELTLRKIDRAYGWPGGHAQRIATLQPAPAVPERLRRAVADAAEGAAEGNGER